jgi:dGTP triphosphohydrolase
MSKSVDDVIFRMKNLKEYKVVRDVSDDFVLNGKMPYDIKLDNNNVLTVTLMAVSREEAERRVSEFISGMNDDHMD